MKGQKNIKPFSKAKHLITVQNFPATPFYMMRLFAK